MPGGARRGPVAVAAGAKCPFPRGSTQACLHHGDVPHGDVRGAASSLSSASDFCVGVFKTGKSLDVVDPERRSLFAKCFTVGHRGWGPADAIGLPELSKAGLIASSLFPFFMGIVYKMAQNSLALPLVPEPATKE